jgi:hypothetical protein
VSEYLYHVTFAANLPGITRHGLLPGSAGRSNFTGYASWSRDRIFFTVSEGADCWWEKLERTAFDRNEPEDIVGELQIPVLLRVLRKTVERLGIEKDPHGFRDCGYQDSFFTKKSVPASLLRVWDGKQWVRTSADPEQIANAYVSRSEHVLESDGTEWLDVDLHLPDGWS